jgi:hypothetical protein
VDDSAVRETRDDMPVQVPNPVNETQREFKRLCELGGGRNGGPVRHKVLELLRSAGQDLNAFAFREVAAHLAACPGANPWHVCFAFGLPWGHLAKLDVRFTQAAVAALSTLSDDDLHEASAFFVERGPDPIEQSLRGAHSLFEKVKLPPQLPSTLDQLARAQERWMTPILSRERPRYIGAWNASAMFMIALFTRPALAATQVTPKPILPPGGPVHAGLALLHRAGIVSRPPSGTELDDEAFEPGALYENNALLMEMQKALPHWSLVDVHSGVYMLGTRRASAD